MASFKAENIETDDESDDEHDDTKEIQIEEALKVYQTAVKLQSQGEAYLQETKAAYKTLFESEVFKYPESLSEYSRAELLGDQYFEDDLWLGNPLATTLAPAPAVENAPSTLPQVLHLSYKNRGQLQLDTLQAALKSDPESTDIYTASIDALSDFTEALDKDIDDVDLWRKASKVSQKLRSERISRYCLETILEGDEQGTDETLGDLGMEMKLADADLKQVIQKLSDHVSAHDSASGNQDLLKYWQAHLALYPHLPEIQERFPSYDRDTIQVTSEPTWSSVGSAILERLTAEQDGATHSKPDAPWKINIPSLHDSTTNGPSPPAETDALETKPVEESNEMIVEVLEPLSPEIEHKPTNEPMPTEATTVEHTALSKTISVEELPIRKRSSEAAELPGEPEGGRIRSKRLRARESMAGDTQQSESTSVNTNTGFDQKIQISTEADEWLFDTLAAIMEKIGIEEIKPSKTYRDLISPISPLPTSTETPSPPFNTAMLDFYAAMQNWTAAKTQKLLMSGKTEDTFEEARRIGLSSYLEYANPKHHKTIIEHFNTNLDSFISTINDSQRCTSEVAFDWVCSLLCSRPTDRLGHSSYMLDAWPPSLKSTILQILTKLNDLLHARLSTLFWEANTLATAIDDDSQHLEFTSRDGFLLDLSQSLFELHLDDYLAIEESTGSVATEAKLHQRVRLNNWARLAHDTISLYSDHRFEFAPLVKSDFSNIQRRHLWASVYQLKALGEVKREHLVLCIEDLKREVVAAGNTIVELPNSSSMPELSDSAAESEISKLETMDFFLNIFSTESQAPVDLIENLEPLLENSIQSNVDQDTNEGGLHASPPRPEQLNEVPPDTNERSRSTFQILAHFIKSAGAQLRLSLWHRLLEAYENIDYPPKMFSIHLRSIQVIMEELDSPSYTNKQKEDREELLLAFLHELSTILEKVLVLIKEQSDVLDCLDLNHLRASIKAVADLWVLLYSVGLFDDYSQAGGKGGSSVNPFRSYPSGGTFHTASVKLHDMQAQIAILLYKLMVEAMEQMSEVFPSIIEIKLEYLRHMHYQFGVRRICKAFDSFFLHFMKDELLKLPHLEYQSSTDLAQVLHDLYDLHCFPLAADRQSHGCDADYLDRKTAMQLIDFVMDKASRISVKELLKSDLGKSIEKLHGTLGMVKSNLAAIRNHEFYSAYLKTPTQPLELFRCLDGISDLSTVSVSPEEAPIASKGWYFLKGQISLAKYRAPRARNVAGDEDDLQDAIGFFMQDLELTAERWETWYRMAQAHDCLLEERILWSSEKLNSEQNELSQLQRATIHCYAMATAVANRSAEVSKESLEKLTDLYTDFGTCIYSATREPFKMRAFSLKDSSQKQALNDGAIGDRSSKAAYSALPRAKAWKFCIALLRRAIAYKPQKWVNHYVLGKCLWKIHTRSERPKESRIAVQKALKRAIELLPERKDPGRQEPILEPIYKFVSITYKLVKREEVNAQQGAEDIEKILLLQRQIDITKRPMFSESTSWSSHIIDVLKLLRAADKPRWHHRLVLRAAHMMHAESDEQAGGSKAAKDYLLEQHIYSTKTYALSIWKPENERPGRHWVYTKQYAMFLAQLLDETDDVEGIQLLAKRVRKKPNDFFEHTQVWEDVFERHVAAHRRYGRVSQDCSDLVFRGLDQEEFQKRADLIDGWINTPNNPHRLFEVIRETSELKKLNAGLVKSSTIDDLLADTYAEIWKIMGSSTEAAPVPSIEGVPEKDNGPLTTMTQTEETGEMVNNSPSKDVHRNVMSLTNLMNLDGASDFQGSKAATPTPSQPDQTVTKSKSRLVSKREIVKRANEATINRSVPKATTPPPAKPSMEPSYSLTPRVVIRPNLQKELTATREADSVRGSVHDDADDESELTELDVEEEEEEEDADDEEETSVVVLKPMFPNLRSTDSDTDDEPDPTQTIDEGRDTLHDEEDVAAEEDSTVQQVDGMDVD